MASGSIQLAAQTLQSFFTGGGTAREHAEYPLAEVKLLSPVLHPPSIRIFDEQDSFVFANPAAVRGPGAEIPGTDGLALAPRVAAVIGADGVPAAFTILAEWRDPGRRPPKDRDFALGLGPVAVTADDVRARRLRAARTGRRGRAPPAAGSRLRLAIGGRACRRSDEALPGRPRRRAELRRRRADRSPASPWRSSSTGSARSTP